MNRKKEKGFALVLSLVLLLVMSLMGGSLIVIASGDHRSNNTSDEYQQVFYVAETALMEGEKWISDNYLGHWYDNNEITGNANADKDKGYYKVTIVEPWKERCKPIIEAGNTCEVTEEEEEAWRLMKEENEAAYKTHVEAYEEFSQNNLVRHTWAKGPAFNELEVKKEDKTLCMKSFKNFKYDTSMKISYALPNNHPRLGSFWNIVGPIVKSSYIRDDSKLKQEEEYLKRFKYTFFIQHIGYSPYKGIGASVQTSTATNTIRMGSAYKIYGCGLLYDRKNTQIEIIVPLESVIVMPY